MICVFCVFLLYTEFHLFSKQKRREILRSDRRWSFVFFTPLFLTMFLGAIWTFVYS